MTSEPWADGRVFPTCEECVLVFQKSEDGLGRFLRVDRCVKCKEEFPDD